MKPMTAVAALGLALGIVGIGTAQADTWRSGPFNFTLDFVDIGDAGNAADTAYLNNDLVLTSHGAVSYDYRMSAYEISQNNLRAAKIMAGENSPLSRVTGGGWTGNQPLADVSWYEAAVFVNFLNTKKGKTPAYDLTYNNASGPNSYIMNLWSSEQAWTKGGTNPYRNKDAFYFLPSEDEWYKAAYYNPAGSDYFLYPTGSNSIPTPVASGTTAGTAVYDGTLSLEEPAAVDSAGGLSPYDTMGQGGNVWEWTETSTDGLNTDPYQQRWMRGGGTEDHLGGASYMAASDNEENYVPPFLKFDWLGFRVASVPEPSTALLVLVAGGAWLLRKRLRRSL